MDGRRRICCRISCLHSYIRSKRLVLSSNVPAVWPNGKASAYERSVMSILKAEDSRFDPWFGRLPFTRLSFLLAIRSVRLWYQFIVHLHFKGGGDRHGG